MSGLEKFQPSEAWRVNFKKFLFMNRKPETVQNPLSVTESQRYSLDIDEDLKNIIEQKKNKKAIRTDMNEEIINTRNITTEQNVHSNLNMLESDDKNEEIMKLYEYRELTENSLREKTSNESFEMQKTFNSNGTSLKFLSNEDENKGNNVLVWQNGSDESFEALERMCDKTASDPNSTLFQYLHSESKDEILAKVKKRSADGKILNIQNQEDQLLMKINNCTLLDDVEAPSRMWENTICGDTVLQTSPVKMIGLLRPSTIIEEAPNDSASSNMSSQMSFCSATKNIQSDISSSTYETAHDFTAASNKTDFSNNYRTQECQFVDITENNKKKQEGHEDIFISSDDVMEATIIEAVPLSNKNQGETVSNTNDTSVDLIDLEKTFGPLQSSGSLELEESFNGDNRRNNENEFEDDSIIEILSDGELEDEQTTDYIKSIKIERSSDTINVNNDTHGVNYTSQRSTTNSGDTHVQWETSLQLNVSTNTDLCSNLIDIKKDIDRINEIQDNDKENYNDTCTLSEKSIQFNDTMEEVEYMLKKGMEYMTAEAISKKSSEKKIAPLRQECRNNQQNSDMKHTKIVKHTSSPKAISSKYTTPSKGIPPTKGSSSTSKRLDIDIKPFPKLDIFAKHPLHARTTDLSSKKLKFSHIVSPIGTYMKKTAKAPLMSSMNYKTKNYFNSTAIMELENESRLYKSQYTTNESGSEALGLPTLPGLNSSAKRALPKKAYISSDLKHIVDERTPVTIPGGKKIQKYLENAMMPAVLRHEGKFKMPNSIGNKLPTSVSSSSGAPSKLPLKMSDTNSTVTESASYAQQRVNASLADLSLMSGDVSMYTIMDAQKF